MRFIKFPSRPVIALIAMIIAMSLIAILQLVLEKNSISAALLLDYTDRNLVYPLSVQNVMWVVFWVGLGELWSRYQSGSQELAQLKRRFLPEDEKTIIHKTEILGKIYSGVRQKTVNQELFLPRLIQRIILQFYNSHSIDQANSLLNSSLDLYLHEIDLRYNMLRYIMWLIPSLGFIGTVIGITLALNYAGASSNANDPNLLSELTARLAVAFNTTLLALLQTAVLVFAMHIIQAREELALNRAGQYCLDNLINRLYNP